MVFGWLGRASEQERRSMPLQEPSVKPDEDRRLDLTPPEGQSQEAQVIEAERRPMRRLLQHLREQAIRVAYEGARIRGAIATAYQGASQQHELIQHIEVASGQTQKAVEDAARRAEAVASANQSTIEQTRTTQERLTHAASGIESAYSELIEFQKEVEDLTNASQDIARISKTVEGFSKQTNLLALNASVEAARAGEAGQSFAVVAQEVKELAQKVKQSNEEIRETITNVDQKVTRIGQSVIQISTHTEATREVIQEASSYFDSLVSEAQQNHDELQAIGSALEELSTANVEINNQVQEIARHSGRIRDDTHASEECSRSLRDSTESMMLEMFQLRVGEGEFEALLERFCHHRDRIQARMQEIADRGVNLFDTDYQEVSSETTPRKYTTSYTRAIADLQPLLDASAEVIDDAAFSLLVDRQGYCPLNLSRISQEPTGDPDRDLKYSRHQRFFLGNETEQRRAQNTQPFLLQINIRDTGEILADLSVPLQVAGRPWGNLVLGFPPGKIARL